MSHEAEIELIELRLQAKIAELKQGLILRQIAVIRKMAIYRREHGQPTDGFGYVIQMTESIMDQFNHDYREDERNEQVS